MIELLLLSEKNLLWFACKNIWNFVALFLLWRVPNKWKSNLIDDSAEKQKYFWKKRFIKIFDFFLDSFPQKSVKFFCFYLFWNDNLILSDIKQMTSFDDRQHVCVCVHVCVFVCVHECLCFCYQIASKSKCSVK